MSSKSVWLLVAAAAFLTSCLTPHKNPHLPDLISSSEYEKVVAQATQSKKQYDGLMNVLDIMATLNRTTLVDAQLESNARIFQWTAEQFEEEKKKTLEKNKTQTTVFLSFFHPSENTMISTNRRQAGNFSWMWMANDLLAKPRKSKNFSLTINLSIPITHAGTRLTYSLSKFQLKCSTESRFN